MKQSRSRSWFGLKWLMVIIAIISALIYAMRNTGRSRKSKKGRKAAAVAAAAVDCKNTGYFPGKFNFMRTNIWSNVVDKYGLAVASSMFPKTYLLPQDVDRFVADQAAQPDQEYIAKTLYSGARVGVELYDDQTMRKEVTEGTKYAVIQEFIKNPLLINGFKFDVRFFLVVDCRKGIYLYRGSYNVFAEKPFDYHSTDRRSKINQANGTDAIYMKHQLPRTMTELARDHHVPYEQILQQLATNLQRIVDSSEPFCRYNNADEKQRNLKDGLAADHKIWYNIYGVDVEILDDYTPLIIEINSCTTINFPDVPWKNELTQRMRQNLPGGNYDTTTDWIQLHTES